MFGLFDSIADWFRRMYIDGIIGNFTGMFNELNVKVGEISEQVGQTPQGWNTGIFNLIRTLSETVVIPVSGIILTFILCYELITMVIEKNNMHDFETFVIFKWIFSATRSHTNTTLQGKPCGHSPSSAKNGGLSIILEATTDTLKSGMRG